MFYKKSILKTFINKSVVWALTVCFCLGFFTTLYAEGEKKVKVLGEDLTTGLFYKLSDNVLTAENATQADYNIYFDASKNTLYLKDFSYEGNGQISDNGDVSVIELDSDENINIICEGNNMISLSAAGRTDGQLIAGIINQNAGLNIETKDEGKLTINVNGANYVEYSQNSAKDTVAAIYANKENADVYINADLTINLSDADPEKGTILAGIEAGNIKLDKSANLSINCGEAYECYGLFSLGKIEVYGARSEINVSDSIANDKRSNAIYCTGNFTVDDRAYMNLKSTDNAVYAGNIEIKDFDLLNVETSDSEAKAFDIIDKDNGILLVDIERNLSNFETEYSAGSNDSMKKINSINAKTFENPCVSLKIYTKINLQEFNMPMLGEELDTQINCKSDFVESSKVYWYERVGTGEESQKTLVEYPEKTKVEAGKLYEIDFEFSLKENYSPSRNYILCLIDGLECKAYYENGKIYAHLYTGEMTESEVKADKEKWKIGEDKGNVSFMLGGNYTKDVLLTVDSKAVNKDLYKYDSGKVMVSDELFNKLLKGKHEIRISSFESGKIVSSSKTAISVDRDVNGSYFWRIIAIGAVVLAVVVASMLVKRKNK